MQKQGNIQGVWVSYTDTRQFVGSLGRHTRVIYTRVILNWHQTVYEQSEQKM